jgi:hypothetical protein
MTGTILQLLRHRHIVRFLSIAIAVVFTAGLAALGPVGKTGPPKSDLARGNQSGSPTPSLDANGNPVPSATPTKGKKKKKKKKKGDTVNPTPLPSPTIPPKDIPDFGLLDQGVTNDSVKVGISYNVNNCGDAAGLAQQFASALGDPDKAIDAMTRHINDTGGIGGREYQPVIVDDGGTCTEKNIAAAIEMLEEKKVFLAIPGLHVESDYLIKRKLPVFGGREDPVSMSNYGANGLMVLEPQAPTFEAWASLGKNYLDTAHHTPCLVRPEPGVSGNWDLAEQTLVGKMRDYGLAFHKIFVYEEKAETGAQQANAIASKAKKEGCDQAWFLAGNPIALVFFTKGATQNNWFPQWTWTGITIETDQQYAGALMDQRQWNNSVGLSTRVPAGEHDTAGNCAEIYRHYYPNDPATNATSASTNIACAQILTTAEMMRRAVALTGKLTSDTLLLGANDIRRDFFYDGTVPMDFSIPGVNGPFKTRGFSHYTIAKWSSANGDYTFPEYPCYYRLIGPNKSGCEDLRKYFQS